MLFAGLWLSELVPALHTGTVPPSLIDAGLWVNPIHVIDLSVVLPGFIISRVAALQSRAHGLFWLAPWLVFSVLMGSSIIAAMVLTLVAGTANAARPHPHRTVTSRRMRRGMRRLRVSICCARVAASNPQRCRAPLRR